MQILNRLNEVDERMFLWCVDYCNAKGLILLARGISKSGDGYLQIILPLALWLYFGSSASHYVAIIVIALVIERCLYWVLKNSLKRKRPPAAIPAFEAFITASDEFSFPSGHTSAAFLLAVLTALSFPAIATPLFIWAAAVGISRVILGVHFPADIVAGACLGSLIAYYSQQTFLASTLL